MRHNDQLRTLAEAEAAYDQAVEDETAAMIRVRELEGQLASTEARAALHASSLEAAKADHTAATTRRVAAQRAMRRFR